MASLFDLTYISAQHPKVKEYIGLKNKPAGTVAAIEGQWALGKALAAGAQFETLFICPELIFSDQSKSLVQDCLKKSIPSFIVSERIMQRMVERDKPDGLAALVKLPTPALNDIKISPKMRVIVLDSLEIPGNLGTIIRAADASATHAVILTNKRTHITHPKAVHGSMGSIFSVKTIVADVPEVVAWLRKHNFTIFTASTKGSRNYRGADYTNRCALVMGSERFGISPEWHKVEDVGVHIPMLGVSDSLNVGHAAALLLYEALYWQQPELFK